MFEACQLEWNVACADRRRLVFCPLSRDAHWKVHDENNVFLTTENVKRRTEEFSAWSRCQKKECRETEFDSL
jgi:hypothetical protein